jgi:hypothetical protein
MQTKPNAVMELQEGTLACSSANPEFRKYFNWMAAALLNMLTDSDAQLGRNGFKVDLSIQDHPKIKIVYV